MRPHVSKEAASAIVPSFRELQAPPLRAGSGTRSQPTAGAPWAAVGSGTLLFRDRDRQHPVTLTDLIYDLETLGDLTKYRVPPVQMRLRGMAHKELGSPGVFARVGH